MDGWPTYRVSVPRIPAGVPDPVAAEVSRCGVPQYFFGCISPLAEACPLTAGGRRLVALAETGREGRICVAVDGGAVVHVPVVGLDQVNAVNASLELFNQSIASVIARFPFYAEEEDSSSAERVADELRERLERIDATAAEVDGLWSTFCDDVEMFLYPTEQVVSGQT